MTTLPTGEQLPEYDDDPAVDPATLWTWLTQHRPRNWIPFGDADKDGLIEQVADVLHALQVVSDAQLVKNATYRAMRRDGRDIERLAAALDRIGANARVVEHNGNVVDAAIDGLELLRPIVEAAITDGLITR